MQLAIWDIDGFQFLEPAPVRVDEEDEDEPRKGRTKRVEFVCPCLLCGREVLVRPGYCLQCSRRAGATLVPAKSPAEKPSLDPGREARIRKYAERAARKAPLFGSDPAPVQISEVA